tara:strand:+ start:735 stop:950 length:216 start_codon:yes stop_codon:yes gene_type:complete
MPRVSQAQKLEVTLARLEERVEALQEDMKFMKSDISELRATANRWRGAFWVLMGLGGVVGIVVNFALSWIK